jgi:hypothetical protein
MTDVGADDCVGCGDGTVGDDVATAEAAGTADVGDTAVVGTAVVGPGVRAGASLVTGDDPGAVGADDACGRVGATEPVASGGCCEPRPGAGEFAGPTEAGAGDATAGELRSVPDVPLRCVCETDASSLKRTSAASSTTATPPSVNAIWPTGARPKDKCGAGGTRCAAKVNARTILPAIAEIIAARMPSPGTTARMPTTTPTVAPMMISRSCRRALSLASKNATFRLPTQPKCALRLSPMIGPDRETTA